MARVYRFAATAGAVMLITLIGIGAASAQSYYYYQYQQYTGPAAPRDVVNGPVTMCGSPQAFRELLVAQLANDVNREGAVLGQNCAREPVGTRLLVTGDPQSVGVWDSAVTYTVVPVRVLNGPDRGMDGYVITVGL